MSMVNATLSHITWLASDVGRTRDFLTDLFGWEFEPQGDDYLVAGPASGARIGLSTGFVSGEGRSFLPQIAVTDLADIVERADRMGVLDEVGEIYGLAKYADLRDPDGAVFSVLEFAAN
jgi:predicted enzyme related to lactoylglutathione lyase